MSVAVISKTGVRLMPTSEYRARKLLDSGKAIIYGYRPFTIQLTERETGDVQPVELCVDTGYIHIGVSVKSEKHEYLGLQVDTLTDEKTKHDDRRMYRRQKRNRKRYRKPRFDNRKRETGWLAPSLEHKKEIHLQIITAVCEVYPIADIALEMGNFDTQVLKAQEEGKPLPQGTDIQYRSQGGTNRMSNLITLCEKCHTPANHRPGGKLYGWKPKVASFKGATYMTAVRWQLYDKVKEISECGVHITYGAETKERRRSLDIGKSHVNDAFVMGRFHPKHRSTPVLYKKKRRNNRCLEKFYDAKYIDSRNGKKRSGQELFNGRISRNHKKDSEDLHRYRKKKVSRGKRTIRVQRYKIQPHDIVLFDGKKYETTGCHNKGSRAILLPEKKSKSVEKLKIYKYAGGYYPSKFA